jgi:hypothetical protein
MKTKEKQQPGFLMWAEALNCPINDEKNKGKMERLCDRIHEDR